MFTPTCNYHRLAVNSKDVRGKLTPEVSNTTLLSPNEFQGKGRCNHIYGMLNYSRFSCVILSETSKRRS